MLVLYGGSGFIGRHICEASNRQNIELGVISRSSKTISSRKLSNIKTAKIGTPASRVLLKKASTIVYLANSSKPSSVYEAMNDIVSEDLKVITDFMEELQSINSVCSFIYLSSGGQVYGPNHRNLISEKNIVNPVTSYALCKCLKENILHYFSAMHDRNITILRLANPVGYWQFGTSHGLVTAAITSALKGEVLKIYGNGKNERDYFDVDEFSDFICKLHRAKKIPSGTYNIGSEISSTELDIISAIEDTLKLSLKVNFVSPRNFDFPYAVLDSSKAKKELGWKANLSIEQIICKVTEEIRSTISF